MTTDYIRTSYVDLKKGMAGYHESRSLRIEPGDRNLESFVKFVQPFSGKTTTKLRSTTLVV